MCLGTFKVCLALKFIPSAGTAEPGAKQKLEPFKGLQKANVEALRYRAEDIARSLTSKVIKEASICLHLALA